MRREATKAAESEGTRGISKPSIPVRGPRGLGEVSQAPTATSNGGFGDKENRSVDDRPASVEARIACLTCKSRKRKCRGGFGGGESCERCVRLSINCKYPGHGLARHYVVADLEHDMKRSAAGPVRAASAKTARIPPARRNTLHGGEIGRRTSRRASQGEPLDSVARTVSRSLSPPKQAAEPSNAKSRSWVPLNLSPSQSPTWEPVAANGRLPELCFQSPELRTFYPPSAYTEHSFGGHLAQISHPHFSVDNSASVSCASGMRSQSGNTPLPPINALFASQQPPPPPFQAWSPATMPPSIQMIPMPIAIQMKMAIPVHPSTFLPSPPQLFSNPQPFFIQPPIHAGSFTPPSDLMGSFVGFLCESTGTKSKTDPRGDRRMSYSSSRPALDSGSLRRSSNDSDPTAASESSHSSHGTSDASNVALNTKQGIMKIEKKKDRSPGLGVRNGAKVEGVALFGYRMRAARSKA